MTEKRINEIVHKLYWEQDVNCAGTMLRCLGEAFQVKLDRQVLSAAAGMHGPEDIGRSAAWWKVCCCLSGYIVN